MPLIVGCSKSVIRKNAAHLRGKGYEPGQAWRIANDLARKHRRMCKHTAHLKKPKKRRRRGLFG